ncbi:MAG: chitobiase/beta-hexosaminidase C-terminal domain-containing protein [Lachnospiraceae bacterium]|nr:chitobiase/beta-hexosaminidase C-terminal domain-containing protein [Lachnospiraceae bacterium]
MKRQKRLCGILSWLLTLALVLGDFAPVFTVRAEDAEGGIAVWSEEQGEDGSVSGPETAQTVSGTDAVSDDELTETVSDPDAAEPEGEEADEGAEGEAEIPDPDEAALTVRIRVKYGQTEARKAAVSVNDLRASKSVAKLAYDYDLEKKAMQRAAEVAFYFSETRPNGEKYTDILKKEIVEKGVQELRFRGNDNAAAAVGKWMEGSSDQLMKDGFKYVAIGHAALDGEHYWVIEYTNVEMKASDAPKADDSETDVEMNVQEGLITGLEVTPSVADNSKLNIEYNKETALPVFSCRLAVNGHEPAGKTVPVKGEKVEWKLADKDFAKIKDGKITGLVERGDSKVSATVSLCGRSKDFNYKLHIVVHPSSVVFSEKEKSLEMDEEYQLVWTVLPDDADDKSVTFKLGKGTENLAVSKKGLVTAMGNGTGEVIVETVDGKKTDVCRISVSTNQSVAMPVLDPSTGIIREGESFRLSSDTPLATIRYTLDGSEPSAVSGNVYSGPFTITEDCMLKAVACKELYFGKEGEEITKSFLTSAKLEQKLYVLGDNWGDVEEDDREQWGTSDKVPAGLWVAAASIPELPYTGQAYKPDLFRVYDHTALLRPGTDYTITYKNNVNAGKAIAVFKFKGNIQGKLNREFTITPAAIGGAEVSASDGIWTGSVIVPKVTVKWNGKILKENVDYAVSCDRQLKDEGDYELTITGKGNLNGSVTCAYSIIKQASVLDLSAAKIGKIPDQKWIAEGYVSGNQLKDKKGNAFVLSVKIGKQEVPAGDYETEILHGNAVGTATLRIKGNGTKTAGYKDISFKIKGTDISKAVTVAKIADQTYTGTPLTPEVTVTAKSGYLITEACYNCVYSKNVKAGTAKVTIYGVEQQGFSGKISKSFRIVKANLNDLQAAGRLEIDYDKETVYVKGGEKPLVLVSYKAGEDLVVLEEGKDFTLKCGNNKNVAAATDKNAPWFQVVGKGSYSGKSNKILYSITAKSLGHVTAVVPDVEYKAGKPTVKCMGKVTVTDENGKKLKMGTDLDTERSILRYLENTYVKRGTVEKCYVKAGDPVEKNDIAPVGTALTQVFYYKEGGNYCGTLRINLKVVDTGRELSAAKAKIANQFYTGEAVTLTKDQINPTIRGTAIPKDCYDIVAYEKNTKIGTAKVTIEGRNGYGGRASFSFKIVKQPADRWVAGSGKPQK